ncbi:hypothetical protein GGI12_000659 [Dipsacomyces acuminosporus]|nr:hypothetical protein GGI12_000659 [Dipsacomyces acuminosporus]
MLSKTTIASVAVLAGVASAAPQGFKFDPSTITFDMSKMMAQASSALNNPTVVAQMKSALNNPALTSYLKNPKFSLPSLTLPDFSFPAPTARSKTAGKPTAAATTDAPDAGPTETPAADSPASAAAPAAAPATVTIVKPNSSSQMKPVVGLVLAGAAACAALF